MTRVVKICSTGPNNTTDNRAWCTSPGWRLLLVTVRKIPKGGRRHCQDRDEGNGGNRLSELAS